MYNKTGLFFRSMSLKYKIRYSSAKMIDFFSRSYLGIIFAMVLLTTIYFFLLYASFLIGKEIEGFLFNISGLNLWIEIKILEKIFMPTVNFLKIVLPLSLPFFYFIYKEQKTLAMSSGFWNRSMIYYIGSSALAITLGYHLNSAVHTHPSLKFTGNYILFCVLLLIVLLNGILVISFQIKSLNLNFSLKKSIDKFDNQYDDLYIIDNFNSQVIYDQLNNIVESIYQMFMLSIEKNVNNCYNINMITWRKILSGFKEKPIVLTYSKLDKKYEDIVLKINKNTKQYESLYRVILKNQVNIISKLFQTNKIEDAQESIKHFTDLSPTEENLKPDFYTSLHELALIVYKQEFLETILEQLSISQQFEFSIDEEEGAGNVNLIYEKLLILTVSKNDIKSTSSICYSMIKILTPKQIEDKGEEIFIPNPTQNVSEKNINSILYIVFLSLIKSVELSHYAITGFLIKFLVTNFSGAKIKEIFGKLLKTIITNDLHDNPFIVNNSKIETSFNINKTTLRYCTEKMSILLYFQQKYAQSNKLKIDSRISIQPIINLSHVAKVPYLEYILNKIENAKDKFGLIYLKDKVFFDHIKKELLSQNAKFKSGKEE